MGRLIKEENESLTCCSKDIIHPRLLQILEAVVVEGGEGERGGGEEGEGGDCRLHSQVREESGGGGGGGGGDGRGGGGGGGGAGASEDEVL